ncbi:pyruvate kinase [Holotrichia oblita]|uniref:Pyruvate kinase n=1 Tax=Holotrichia oblita TaxID=644536 RepID=A0ACB9SPQ1_HOLOL|nr:pyruvate kinase [Holotrichia oblita]
MGNTTSYFKFGASSPHLQLLATQRRDQLQANNVCLSGIVCTIGPGSTNENILVEMMRAGMRIARLNFSHGSHAEHGDRIKTIRKAMELYQERYNQACPLAIALDTKGPEIRTGIIEQGERSKVELKQGSLVKLTNALEYNEKCTDKIIYINYQMLLQKIGVNQEIYIDDGKIILKCDKIENNFVEYLPVISDQDEKDLKFAVENGIDMIFASFVTSSNDIAQIRGVLGEAGKNILIISKIESAQALKDLSHIVNKSDGVMVARGDLALQVPFEQLFQLQKQIIAMCNIEGKPVICATQMLESMMDKQRPSRADVSDIGNAIFDGADCVMLSGETAVGKYPVESVQTMAKICIEAENINWTGRLFHEILTLTFSNNTPDGYCMSAVAAATFYEAAAIIVTSNISTELVKLIAKFKPRCPIIAVTKDVKFSRQIGLYRAAYSVVYEEVISEQTTVEVTEDTATTAAKKENDIKKELRCAVDYGTQRDILRGEDTVVVLRSGELHAVNAGRNMIIETATVKYL